MARMILPAALTVAILGFGCDQDEFQPDPCVAEVAASFSSLDESPVSTITVNGIRLEVRSGTAQGYHDGHRWNLLVLEDTELWATPPCDAREVVLEVERSSLDLEVELFQQPTAEHSVGRGTLLSSTADASALDPPFVAWRVPVERDDTTGFVKMTTPGEICFEECQSLLVRSITFR